MTQPVADILKLSHDAIIDLFVLDLNSIGYPQVFRFCNHTINGAEIVWQGFTYAAIPIEASGFEMSGQGRIPTPQLTVSNLFSIITSFMFQYDDFIGAKLTRKRTLAKYLDAKPTADPNQFFDSEIWFVDRKVSETKLAVTFELAASIDLQGVRIPGRIITSNICLWQYRGLGCGYTGGAVADENDAPTNDPNRDMCGKRIPSCKLRFGQYSPLPIGVFPGAGNQRS